MNIIPLISRIAISLIFIISGVFKIINLEGNSQFLAGFGVPGATFFVIIALAIEIIGGLFVLLGFKGRLAALVLALYLIPLTLIMHTNFADPNQQVQFLKNLAILGGLLYIYNFGAGPMSIGKKE